MRHFLILFKHEFKMQFPQRKKDRIDIIGTALSFLITALILGVFIYLLSTIAQNYVSIKIVDTIKDTVVSNPTARTVELLNVIYTFIIVALSAMMLEKMRSTLARQQDKVLFLRMPVKQQTIFLSKLATLLISNYLTAFVLIFSINAIFYFSLKPALIFWAYTFIIWLLLPLVPLLIASILLVPYIKIVDFISSRYFLMFLVFTGAIVGSFLIYAEILEIIQALLETGSIKFLFNAQFINTLDYLMGVTYPANCFAYIAVGKFFDRALPITIGIGVIALIVLYSVAKALYYITLYKNESRKKVRRKMSALFRGSLNRG